MGGQAVLANSSKADDLLELPKAEAINFKADVDSTKDVLPKELINKNDGGVLKSLSGGCDTTTLPGILWVPAGQTCYVRNGSYTYDSILVNGWLVVGGTTSTTTLTADNGDILVNGSNARIYIGYTTASTGKDAQLRTLGSGHDLRIVNGGWVFTRYNINPGIDHYLNIAGDIYLSSSDLDIQDNYTNNKAYNLYVTNGSDLDIDEGRLDITSYTYVNDATSRIDIDPGTELETNYLKMGDSDGSPLGGIVNADGTIDVVYNTYLYDDANFYCDGTCNTRSIQLNDGSTLINNSLFYQDTDNYNVQIYDDATLTNNANFYVRGSLTMDEVNSTTGVPTLNNNGTIYIEAINSSNYPANDLTMNDDSVLNNSTPGSSTSGVLRVSDDILVYDNSVLNNYYFVAQNFYVTNTEKSYFQIRDDAQLNNGSSSDSSAWFYNYRSTSGAEGMNEPNGYAQLNNYGYLRFYRFDTYGHSVLNNYSSVYVTDDTYMNFNSSFNNDNSLTLQGNLIMDHDSYINNGVGASMNVGNASNEDLEMQENSSIDNYGSITVYDDIVMVDPTLSTSTFNNSGSGASVSLTGSSDNEWWVAMESTLNNENGAVINVDHTSGSDSDGILEVEDAGEVNNSATLQASVINVGHNTVPFPGGESYFYNSGESTGDLLINGYGHYVGNNGAEHTGSNCTVNAYSTYVNGTVLNNSGAVLNCTTLDVGTSTDEPGYIENTGEIVSDTITVYEDSTDKDQDYEIWNDMGGWIKADVIRVGYLSSEGGEIMNFSGNGVTDNETEKDGIDVGAVEVKPEGNIYNGNNRERNWSHPNAEINWYTSESEGSYYVHPSGQVSQAQGKIDNNAKFGGRYLYIEGFVLGNNGSFYNHGAGDVDISLSSGIEIFEGYLENDSDGVITVGGGSGEIFIDGISTNHGVMDDWGTTNATIYTTVFGDYNT